MELRLYNNEKKEESKKQESQPDKTAQDNSSEYEIVFIDPNEQNKKNSIR